MKRYLAMNRYIGGKIVQPTVIRDSRQKSGIGKMNGTAISQREITPAK
jgi:hypothetical protein